MEHVQTESVDGFKLSFEDIMVHNKGKPLAEREPRTKMPPNRDELKSGITFFQLPTKVLKKLQQNRHAAPFIRDYVPEQEIAPFAAPK